MEENILDQVMKKSIEVMISNAGSDKKINKLKKKHEKKRVKIISMNNVKSQI